MNDRATWVLAFDVADPRRLRKLSKFLLGKGHRVQRSVFEVMASRGEMTTIVQGATMPERFQAEWDSLRVYRLCQSCVGASEVRGEGPAPLTGRGPVVF